jgi:O-acetyl-ADP-ribose deacetylase (regulator of RNase III)
VHVPCPFELRRVDPTDGQPGDRPGHREDRPIVRSGEHDGHPRRRLRIDVDAADVHAEIGETVAHESTEQVFADHRGDRHTQTELRGAAGEDRARPADREPRVVDQMFGLTESGNDVATVQDEIGVRVAEYEQVQVDRHRGTLRHDHPATMRPMPSVTLVQGDITAQDVDAVVNAANRSLLGGGGVDGAIHRHGGDAILAECRRLRATTLPDGLPVGDAVATTGGVLPARWVIHTVGPIYSGRASDAELLGACHSSSLRVADEVGADTVAFPAISTGAFGYPVEEAAAVAVDAVRAASTSVREVRFVLYDARSLAAFEAAAAD